MGAVGVSSHSSDFSISEMEKSQENSRDTQPELHEAVTEEENEVLNAMLEWAANKANIRRVLRSSTGSSYLGDFMTCATFLCFKDKAGRFNVQDLRDFLKANIKSSDLNIEQWIKEVVGNYFYNKLARKCSLCTNFASRLGGSELKGGICFV